MMVDQFPELAKLSPDQQLELASELAKQAMKSTETVEISAETVELLEERLTYFLDGKDTGTTWEKLREQRRSQDA